MTQLAAFGPFYTLLDPIGYSHIKYQKSKNFYLFDKFFKYTRISL